MKLEGQVLPPGAIPPKDLGGASDLTLEIVKIVDGSTPRGEGEVWDGMVMVDVKYPDGRVYSHQADNGVSDLLGKVQSKLRNRYGVKEFNYVSTPNALQAGQEIKIDGVNYGS